MSVGRSNFKEVGIRNSDFGALELMWKPGFTRKFKSTVVCAARGVVVKGTGAMVTDGESPSCPTAETAHKTAVRHDSKIRFRKWIFTKEPRRGEPTIAQRFSAGRSKKVERVPEGRLKLSLMMFELFVPMLTDPTIRRLAANSSSPLIIHYCHF